MPPVDPPAPVCLITGGTAGIGLATAHRFAREGHRVAICGRNAERLEKAVGGLRAAFPDLECRGYLADLEEPARATALFDAVLDQFGRIDVLVNNAGFAPLAPFGEIETDQFELTLNVNIRSVFYLTQAVWNQMTALGGGVIVNISSLAAIDPFIGFSIYGSSKAWLDLLTVALAAEGEPRKIRTYSIRPGAVETEMLRGLFPDFPADQCVAPEEIADQVWACVERPADFASGSHIPVTRQP